MSGTWEVLIIGLWLALLLQTTLIVILYRQVGIVYLAQNSARSRDGLPLFARVPHWAGTDHLGRFVDSERLPPRPLLLVFAEPDCGPCQQLMPDLQAFAEEERDRLNVVVVASANEKVNAQMADRYLLDFPLVTQRNREIAGRFEVSVTPFIYVIDGEGRVRDKGVVNTRDQLAAKVASLDAPKEVVRSE